MTDRTNLLSAGKGARHVRAPDPGERRSRRAILALAFFVALWAWPPGSNANEPVRSLLEQRHSGVVTQSWDMSCGAAALATILNYQHGDPVTERELANALIKRDEYLRDPDIVRFRQGFSLADLERVTEARGYVGRGLGKLKLPDLEQRAPIIVPVNLAGFNHFVVFRGRVGNRVLIADPAFGGRTLTIGQFERAWIDYGDRMGKVGFVVTRDDSFAPPDRTRPRLDEFVFLE